VTIQIRLTLPPDAPHGSATRGPKQAVAQLIAPRRRRATGTASPGLFIVSA
jgi:hypothetical protein